MFFIKKRSQEEKLLIKKINEIFGFKPKNIELYQEALRHASVVKKHERKHNNERLEFVGDSILNLFVAETLFDMFPEINEGELTMLRSNIVSRKSLNKLGNEFQLPAMISMRTTTKNTVNTNIAGNCLEAMIAAIYFDKGHKFTLQFIRKIIDRFFPDVINLIRNNNKNFKSLLLTFAQKEKLTLEYCTYENIEVNEKVQHFYCEIFLSDKYVSCGKGWSKKDAEQNAAETALVVIKKNPIKIIR